MGGSVDASQYLTEQEFNTGKSGFLKIITDGLAGMNNNNKVEWKPSTVESIPPLTLPTTTVRDWGEPAFEAPYSDPRKAANPHSTDYYTVGAVSPSKWSTGGW